MDKLRSMTTVRVLAVCRVLYGIQSSLWALRRLGRLVLSRNVMSRNSSARVHGTTLDITVT